MKSATMTMEDHSPGVVLRSIVIGSANQPGLGRKFT
jgi:hypothetical protein